MKKVILSTFLIFAFFHSTLFAYEVTLNDFTGSDALVQINITGDGTRSVSFDVKVLDPAFADIRAVWFNFLVLPSALTVTGENVTGYSFIENGVGNLGNGANLNPLGGFDGGVLIGSSGSPPGDDFYSTLFIVSSSDIINLGPFFGARLTSVGDTNDDREGSSKLAGNYTAVPEPSVMLLFGTGLGISGLMLRKRFK